MAEGFRLRPSTFIELREAPGKGRGVFACRPIPAGSIIEVAPIFLVPLRHIVGGRSNRELGKCFFLRTRATAAVALGYGSLYNHSYTPNARYLDGRDLTLVFVALREIRDGEEICVNYNGVPGATDPVAFRVV